MTKPMNFPGRRLQRRISALERFPEGPSKSGVRSEGQREAERRSLEMLCATPMAQALATRTKKRAR